ncbi:hypothetical protein LIER_43176 [Lithospermum erythrorhizon]|uniref:Uncharacterized protein n=1 Tax=Lithospermum erythrorhizon TaxID=34254 RepID=A0AAV3PLH5_LITER
MGRSYSTAYCPAGGKIYGTETPRCVPLGPPSLRGHPPAFGGLPQHQWVVPGLSPQVQARHVDSIVLP